MTLIRILKYKKKKLVGIFTYIDKYEKQEDMQLIQKLQL